MGSSTTHTEHTHRILSGSGGLSCWRTGVMAMEAKSSGVLTARPSSTSAVVSLNSLLNSSGSECLNECDDHPLDNCLQDNTALLKSDCDEQLIISLAFNQVVKVHSLKLKGPAANGPKTVRVFKNQPRTLDFSQAESMESIQDIQFTSEHLKGEKELLLK